MDKSEKRITRAVSLCQSDPQTELLKAFHNDKINKFKEILENEIVELDNYYNEPEYKGTLLDFASKQPGKHEFIDILLQNGANPNIVNKFYKVAPIHSATISGEFKNIDALLKDSKTEINIKDKYGNTALHYAVMLDSNINEILGLLTQNSNIDINAVNRKGETPLHVAAENRKKDIVEYLLTNYKKKLDIDSAKNQDDKSARDVILEKFDNVFTNEMNQISNARQKTNFDLLFNYLQHGRLDDFDAALKNSSKEYLNMNNGQHTLLQYSCEHGYATVVSNLLESGADPNKTHSKNEESPIMIAAQKGYINILNKFIAIENTSYEPIKGETVLHKIVLGLNLSPGLGDLSEEINHHACLEKLLSSTMSSTKINLNQRDTKGNTALHYAIKIGDDIMTLMLLRAGTYIGSTNSEGETIIANINPKIMERYLDECIYTNESLPQNDNYEIIINYKFLAPPILVRENTMEKSEDIRLRVSTDDEETFFTQVPTTNETEPLLCMCYAPDVSHLLKHPVITSYLHLKWKKIETYFWMNLIFFLLFCILLTIYILTFYNVDGNMVYQNNQNKHHYWGYILWILVLTFLIILAVREFLQFILSPDKYFLSFENILETGVIGVTIIIMFGLTFHMHKEIAAIGILITWTESVLLIGRIPVLSTNIEMFKTVSWNFFKFLVWYSILIIAFSLSFFSLFRDVEEEDEVYYFSNPWISMFKSVLMLTGELDASTIPLSKVPITSHILFVLFVFFIAIVLFNLLNGLAVNDIQGIKSDAELVGYISRTKLVSYFETILSNKLTYCSLGVKLKSLFCCVSHLNCSRGSSIINQVKKYFCVNINLFPEESRDCEITILPNMKNKVELFNSALKKKETEAQNVSYGPFNCKNTNNYTMEPIIVRSAKSILANKRINEIPRNCEINEIFNKIEECKQAVQNVEKKTEMTYEILQELLREIRKHDLEEIL